MQVSDVCHTSCKGKPAEASLCTETYVLDLNACLVQGLPTWGGTFESETTIATVLAAFCRSYSLNTKDCYLVHKTTRLEAAQLLQDTLCSSQHQVCSAVTAVDVPAAALVLCLRHTLLLQRKSKAAQGKPVLLDVVICPSVAHLVWLTFNHANLKAEAAACIDWVAHVDVLVVHDECFTNLFSNKQLLSKLLDLAPTETVLSDGKPLEKDLLSPNILSVSDAVQPIIHLLQELVSSRAKESPELYNARCNSCETHADVSITSPCGHLVAVLRNAILMLKLATLLEQSRVKCSKEVRYAKLQIRLALRMCTDDLRHHPTGNCTSPVVRCRKSERSASAESEEEQHLATKLAQCLLKTLHQALTLKSAYLEESCILLSSLLPESNAPVVKAVAAELLRPGKLFTAHRIHLNFMF